jgi:signal transduction histidine kinase
MLSTTGILPIKNLHMLVRRLRWVTHPITIFVSLQIVWLAITLIWVIWFVGARQELTDLAIRIGKDFIDSTTILATLIVGCILLGVLLVGTILLFIFGQRQSSQARQQRTFVSSVTHELKSPLASLQLAFETMAARTLEPTVQARLHDMIQADIERLKRLVDKILLTGRLDQGIQIYDEDQQFVPVKDFFKSVTSTLTYLDINVQNRISINCSNELSVQLSRSALVLICTNLIENALKYSPKDTEITCEAEYQNGYFTLCIKDRGMGLSGVDRRRIFKMFERGERAVQKAIPGTGLGLYIVRTAVRVLGGKIWAESPGPGLGTSFFVSVPLENKKVKL